MSILKRLKIHRYRNVQPGTELRFSDGYIILLGKNGTGKTTLLEFIASIFAGNFASIRDEFDVAFELSTSEPVASVTGRLSWTRDEHGQFASVGVRAAASRMSLSGECVIESDDLHWHVHIGNHRLTIKHLGTGDEIVSRETSTMIGGFWLQTLMAIGDRVQDMASLPAFVAKMMHTWFLDSANLHRFDEARGSFDRLIGKQKLDGSVVIVDKGRASHVSTYHFVPPKLAREVGERIQRQDAYSLRFTADELDFLQLASELFGVDGASLSISLQSRDRVPNDPEMHRLTFGDVSFYFDLDKDTTITHEELRYGQKRLLSFLYYAEANPGTIIADELVNGMHHEWIEACMDKIANRQSFLSSQNPLLLDYLEFESREHAQKSFILCDLTADRQMVWRNMSDEESRSFYAAYEAGVQHVGSILRTKGLW